MSNSCSYVPYRETGYFSGLVTDYLDGNDNVDPFYVYRPDHDGIDKAIEDRAKYPVDREKLVNTLRKQYAHLDLHEKTVEHIGLLLNENTYTVCTAHQPNLMTGYLYFIYKILHAIRLAEQLNEKYSDKHFVPVYYMGSEDNDLDELGTFMFRGEKNVWDGDGQHGAVGRMATKGLKKITDRLFTQFGPPGKACEELKNILTGGYIKQDTIGKATWYVVNELFGKYGLLILDPDEPGFKRSFVPVMEDELLCQSSFPIVTRQSEKLSAHYKVQAHPREINLFYLADQLRERIERKGEKWEVVNSAISWTKQELIAELKEHPERFSPNVMLRGLFQETILPNVAFIGGGAEVAYWLQLKPLFEHYSVFFPCILLRQSVLWINSDAAKLRTQAGIGIPDIFKPTDELVMAYISKHGSGEWRTEQETKTITEVFQQLKNKAEQLDPTLAGSAAAALAKMKYQLSILEKKMLRAEKRKMETQTARIIRMKQVLFPRNGLQERIENFMEYYLDYGPGWFEVIREGIKPMDHDFLVIE